MVDDGSALNVCPLKLLSRFKIEKAELESSDALIRAYDHPKEASKELSKQNSRWAQLKVWSQ